MKQLITVLFIILTLAGCKKTADNDYYTITGLVLDWDSRAPIAGAQVYAGPGYFIPSSQDSGFSDAGGRISFRYKTEDPPKNLFARKAGYMVPLTFRSRSPATDRTDTLFLARASYLNVHLHRTGSYLPTDSFQISLLGYYNSSFAWQGDPVPPSYPIKRHVNAPDTVLTAAAIYYAAPGNKAFLDWNILRNGTILATQRDSITLIQFGTQNHTLSY